MKSIENDVLLLELVEQLREKGSWCGETHLQKAVYFLQELLSVPMGLEFVLYKHGPFSFGLQDKLILLRAHGLLELEPQANGYGPKLSLSQSGQALKRGFPRTIREQLNAFKWLTDRLGKKGVVDLERLGTALFVSRNKEMQGKGDEEIVARIVELKPHVSEEQARAALREVREMESEAEAIIK